MNDIDKEKITQLALNLYEETFLANQYWSIIKQFDQLLKEYYDEMNYSTAFFHVTYQALIEALIMKLARIYEKGKEAAGIYSLFLMCRGNMEIFPEYGDSWTVECDGEMHTFTAPFEVTLSTNEEVFFPEKMKEYERYQKIANILIPEIDDRSNSKKRLELSREELFEYFQKKYSRLNHICENLRMQRNNVYAHINSKTNFDYQSVYEKYPINKEDVEQLISFALDFSRLCIELLTGVIKPDLPCNIDDLRSLLHFARIGIQYEDLYWKELDIESKRQIKEELSKYAETVSP